MPSQRSRILDRLASNATNRKENAPEVAQAGLRESQVLVHIQKIFPLAVRKELSAQVAPSPDNQIAELADLRVLAEEFLQRGAQAVEEVPADLLNRLGRQNHSGDSTEDGERTRMAFFKRVTQTTTIDYARRLASLLMFCLGLAEQNTREACGLKIKASALEAVAKFSDGFEKDNKDVDNLIELLITLSAEKYGHLEDYNTNMFCSFAIGQLYEAEHGKFKTKESANKTLSAFKYCFRMAILCKIKAGSNQDLALLERVQWDRHADTTTFKQLTILQAGLNSLPRKLKPAAMVLDKNCERISYNGIPCSYDLLNDVLHSTIKTANTLLKDLLKGYRPDCEEEKETEGTMGYSSVPFAPGFAFGEIAESEYGNLSLFDYIIDHAKWKKHFFGPRGAKARKTPARAYLKTCKQLEKQLVVIMHILMGCGTRAPDYKELTFMNGDVESEARLLSIYDDDFIHCAVPNTKGSQLHGKSKAYSTLLPRKLADPLFVAYWKYVRPFASMLNESLGNVTSFERWKRYCFVQACDEKWVRDAVCEAFGGRDTRRTFQWLRHASNFLMNMYVKGETSILPVFKLYGHSESIDATYAVERVSGFTSADCTNITDVRVMLGKHWDKVDLYTRRDEPVDRVETDDNAESEYDSDACSETSDDDENVQDDESNNEAADQDEQSQDDPAEEQDDQPDLAEHVEEEVGEDGADDGDRQMSANPNAGDQAEEAVVLGEAGNSSTSASERTCGGTDEPNTALTCPTLQDTELSDHIVDLPDQLNSTSKFKSSSFTVSYPLP